MMDTITLEQLSKRYRLGKAAGGLPSLPVPRRLARRFVPRGTRLRPKPLREIWALKDVSFSVQPGTIAGIIGPNGSGKSTLLKVLGRITPPTEGRAIVRGRVVTLLEVGAGFQPDMTGRENIDLYAALYGIPHATVRKRFDEIVDFAEVGQLIDTPVRRYSTGTYLRLAFSVAVNMEPTILLADEVLAVGDLNFQERLMQRVQEASSTGMTVLFVSHDMSAVTTLCDRVIWMDAGRIVDDGDPISVVTRYEQSAWTLVNGKVKQGEEGEHVNAEGEIISTRLLTVREEAVDVADASEGAILKTTFSILRPRVTVRCTFVLQTGGIVVCRSVQPEPYAVPAPGIYSVSIRIPGDFLADKPYSVKTVVTIEKDGVETSLLADQPLSFRVSDTDEELAGSDLATSQSDGVISPRFEWQVAKEHDIVVD